MDLNHGVQVLLSAKHSFLALCLAQYVHLGCSGLYGLIALTEVFVVRILIAIVAASLAHSYGV